MNARPMRSLRSALTRVHLRITLFAVGMAGLTVLFAGLATMRGYAQQNLGLIARTASYSVAPALVFEDAEAARDALKPLINSPGIAQLRVLNNQGREVAAMARTTNADSWWTGMLSSLKPKLLTVPVTQDNRQLGTIVAEGDASAIADFVAVGLLGALACLVLTAAAAWALAQRLQHNIVEQLRAIAATAHAVRIDRAFGSRAPSAQIAEISQLSDDFNALLDELELQQNRLQSENATLSHLAAHDPLTGLLNRTAFERRLGFAVEDARLHGEQCAVIYFDGDRFKAVNDTHGHAAGDAVLIAIAKALRAALRPGDCAARLGGDEFAIALLPSSDAETARHTIAAIETSLRAVTTLASGEAISVRLSAGVAVYPEDGADGPTLLRKADKAMYRAKAGRPPAEHQAENWGAISR